MNLRYSYSILRYVHDVVTGEHLNVGVLVVSAVRHEIRMAKSLARIKQAFPSVDADMLRRQLDEFASGFAREADRVAEEHRGVRTASHFIQGVFGSSGCDTSFQWTEGGSGVAAYHDDVIASLMARFVPEG